MPRRLVGRIAFADIEPPAWLKPAEWRGALLDSLVHGTAVERYNRVWRLGPISVDPPLIQGRIGFERATGVQDLWDESIGDFVARAQREGATSPFMIAYRKLLIAFQLRPGVIKRTSFTGAFEAILNEGSPFGRVWSVEPRMDEIAFSEWLSRVDRVTEFRARIERPNPRYPGGPDLERIVEGTNAEVVSLAVRAAKNDPAGIDITDSLITTTIEHVAHEYGYFRTTGEEDGEVTVYDSETDAAPPEVRTEEVDPETREVTRGSLERAVREYEDVEPDQA